MELRMLKLKIVFPILFLLISNLILCYYGGIEGFNVQTQDKLTKSHDNLDFKIAINQTFGGMHSDEASSIIATTDGGFIQVGSTRSFGAGNNDMWFLGIQIRLQKDTLNAQVLLLKQVLYLIN
jgi:hypothetical protein